MADTLDDLMRVKAFVLRYPDVVSEAAMRWQIHNAAINGLQEFGAIVKIGRAVYVHRGRYLDWMLSHAKGGQQRTVTPMSSSDPATGNGSARHVTGVSQGEDGHDG